MTTLNECCVLCDADDHVAAVTSMPAAVLVLHEQKND